MHTSCTQTVSTLKSLCVITIIDHLGYPNSQKEVVKHVYKERLQKTGLPPHIIDIILQYIF